MEAKELRIGNWINYLGSGEVQIKDAKALFNSMEQFNYPHPKVTPIPLTEEWLIEFSFHSCKSSNEEDEVIDYWKNILYFDMAKGLIRISGIETHIEIEYVHQLQNLYFALTGEELNKQD